MGSLAGTRRGTHGSGDPICVILITTEPESGHSRFLARDFGRFTTTSLFRTKKPRGGDTEGVRERRTKRSGLARPDLGGPTRNPAFGGGRVCVWIETAAFGEEWTEAVPKLKRRRARRYCPRKELSLVGRLSFVLGELRHRIEVNFVGTGRRGERASRESESRPLQNPRRSAMLVPNTFINYLLKLERK